MIVARISWILYLTVIVSIPFLVFTNEPVGNKQAGVPPNSKSTAQRGFCTEEDNPMNVDQILITSLFLLPLG